MSISVSRNSDWERSKNETYKRMVMFRQLIVIFQTVVCCCAVATAIWLLCYLIVILFYCISVTFFCGMFPANLKQLLTLILFLEILTMLCISFNVKF